MKLRDDGQGFSLWLSASDTWAWANCPGSGWPCSSLAGRRVFVAYDRHGLHTVTLDGKPGDCCADELAACVADHVAASGKIDEEHPAWFVAVGQFRAESV